MTKKEEIIKKEFSNSTQEIPYLNGKKHGNVKGVYKSTNTLYYLVSYINDEACGLEKVFYPKGHIMRHRTFKKDREFGISMEFTY